MNESAHFRNARQEKYKAHRLVLMFLPSSAHRARNHDSEGLGRHDLKCLGAWSFEEVTQEKVYMLRSRTRQCYGYLCGT